MHARDVSFQSGFVLGHKVAKVAFLVTAQDDVIFVVVVFSSIKVLGRDDHCFQPIANLGFELGFQILFCSTDIDRQIGFWNWTEFRWIWMPCFEVVFQAFRISICHVTLGTRELSVEHVTFSHMLSKRSLIECFVTQETFLYQNPTFPVRKFSLVAFQVFYQAKPHLAFVALELLHSLVNDIDVLL